MGEDKSFVKTDIKIPSKTPGWNLDAWKYLPKTAGQGGKAPPVIVMSVTTILSFWW